MGVNPDLFEAAHRLARRYVRDGLSFWQALTKGRAVFVEGRLQQEEWQTEAGEKRSRLKVVAQRVTFLYRPAPSAAPGEAAPDWVKEEA